VLDTWYLVLGAWYFVPGIQYSGFGTQSLVLEIWDLVVGTLTYTQ
jgi:hypothetical protein